MEMYTFTFSRIEDATKNNISAGMQCIMENLRKKNSVYKGKKLEVGSVIKYEFQERGALHAHCLFVFLNEKKAPVKIVGKIREWWNCGIRRNGCEGGFVSHSKTDSLDGLLGYMSKNDFDNTQENNKKLTKFKHCEKCYSISHNLKIPSIKKIYLSDDEFSCLYIESTLKHVAGHNYYDKNNKLAYCLTHTYHELKDKEAV